MEDSVHNHCKLILDVKDGKLLDPVKSGETLLSKRQYCVQCMKEGEALTLTNVALDRMRRDF